jgi:hypothetical protein
LQSAEAAHALDAVKLQQHRYLLNCFVQCRCCWLILTAEMRAGLVLVVVTLSSSTGWAAAAAAAVGAALPAACWPLELMQTR